MKYPRHIKALQWHHIVVYNPVDSYTNRANIVNAKLWLDGDPLALDTNTNVADTNGFHGSLVLGAGNFGGSSSQIWFGGVMDEFAYWDNIELTNAEVVELYNSGKPTDLNTFSRGIPSMWYRLGDINSYNTLNSNWEIPNQSGIDYLSNRSFFFDGVDEFVDCGADSSLEINGDMTISLWVFPRNLQGADTYPGLVYKGGSSDVNYGLTFNNNGPWNGRYLQFYTDGGNGNAKGTNSAVMSDEWTHVAVVVNSGVTNGTIYYLNGVATDTFTFTMSPAPAGTGEPLQLGRHSVQNHKYPGWMDEVAIFDEAKDIGDLWDGSGRPVDLVDADGIIGFNKIEIFLIISIET